MLGYEQLKDIFVTIATRCSLLAQYFAVQRIALLVILFAGVHRVNRYGSSVLAQR